MPTIFPLLLHDLFYSNGSVMLAGLILLLVPGALFATWGVRVSRRKGEKALAIHAGIAIGVAALATAIVQREQATDLFVAVTTGFVAMALVVHRLAPEVGDRPELQSRWAPLTPAARPGSIGPALFGGAAFALATVGMYTVIASFSGPHR